MNKLKLIFKPTYHYYKCCGSVKPCSNLIILYNDKKVNIDDAVVEYYFDDILYDSFLEVPILNEGLHNFKVIVQYKGITEIAEEEKLYSRFVDYCADEYFNQLKNYHLHGFAYRNFDYDNTNIHKGLIYYTKIIKFDNRFTNYTANEIVERLGLKWNSKDNKEVRWVIANNKEKGEDYFKISSNRDEKIPQGNPHIYKYSRDISTKLIIVLKNRCFIWRDKHNILHITEESPIPFTYQYLEDKNLDVATLKNNKKAVINKYQVCIRIRKKYRYTSTNIDLEWHKKDIHISKWKLIRKRYLDARYRNKYVFKYRRKSNKRVGRWHYVITAKYPLSRLHI